MNSFWWEKRGKNSAVKITSEAANGESHFSHGRWADVDGCGREL